MVIKMEYFDDSILQPAERGAPLTVRLDAAERRYRAQCERLRHAVEDAIDELDFYNVQGALELCEQEAESLLGLREESEMRDRSAGRDGQPF